VKTQLEYALRLVFFACVPFGVVLLALLVPMTGAVINMALALVVFFSSEALIGMAERKPWIGRVLRRQLAFEAYYRERPPRPFLYYVFYPLLLPYWLINRDARQEFFIFKGYTILMALIVSCAGVYRYFFVYQPELGLKTFAAAFGVGLVIETVAVMMLIMPITTSVVALHQKKQHWRLLVLLAVGLASTTSAIVIMAKRHRTFPSLETRQRVVARSAADRTRSKLAMRRALETAWKVRRTGPRDQWERETDGTITGLPLDNAREILTQFYRPDEAGAFELWTTGKSERPAIMLIFAEGRTRGTPVWLGMQWNGTLIEKLPEVPKPGRRAMRSAGDF
jgi:hypothetical protein